MPSEFHDGEAAMREALKVPAGPNPSVTGLPARYVARVQDSPLVAVGTLDEENRPWTTIWGGERGFAGQVAEGVLGLKTAVDRRHDPVFAALWKEADADGVARPNNGQGKMVSALSIDLETRDRVKLIGAFIAGAVVENGVQAAVAVTESLGNCPKYLNKKEVVKHNPDHAELVSNELPLGNEALDVIYKADMFFLSSTNGDSMDTNHRGGKPGFVRILSNKPGEVQLVYPEYSGNRLYQTLGNLRMNPLIGIVIPDFDTASVLYLTGSASVLIGDEASSLLARTRLAVKINVSEAKFVRGGLPFRGALGEYSPYNPPLRYLTAERTDPRATDLSAGSDLTATLVKRELITPTIGIFTWDLSSSSTGRRVTPRWDAGQHITLDFEPELSLGYSHMRDEAPQSINDDFIRTFTVSSPPQDGRLQITARRNGPATGLMWKHNIRVPLNISVLGFAGEAKFRMPASVGSAEKSVFVAGGVGITPVLAQARGVLDAGVDFSVAWSLRGEDAPLAVRSFEEIPGLAGVTTLFVTGDMGQMVEQRLADLGARGIERRRMAASDVASLKGQGRKFYLCAGPRLLKLLTTWLSGEQVEWEDFGY